MDAVLGFKNIQRRRLGGGTHYGFQILTMIEN